ncbi:hypothetical protein BC833DRAFT_620227 [Globomyces pollinis-pini]|nr:hypothetical protein BC833DRAFT_620227 [Globomyces pollinis-pini]
MDGGMLEEAVGAKLIYNLVLQHFWNGSVLNYRLQQNQPSPSKSNRNIRHGCSRCGRDSHSVKACFTRTNVNGQALDSFDSESDSSESDQGACYRCGRSTHFAKDCYARTHINGFSL